jgi:hypothetical protein
MKNLTKIILYSFFGLTAIAFSMYHLSKWNQEKIYENYGMNFNPNRTELGLEKISDKWKKDKLTWEEWDRVGATNEDYGIIAKYSKIFSGKDIQTGFIYLKDSFDIETLHKDKFLWFNSNILFWENEIMAESDSYQKIIDSTTFGSLSLTYHFKDENGNKAYYETHYFENTKEDGFWCGTPIFTEKEEHRISKKPYVGNINKKQADSILKSWNGK